MGQKAPKMTPDGSQGRLKSIKNQGFSWHGFWKAKNRVARFTFACFWLHFSSMFGAKIVGFSCSFFASFFDGFLEASGCILGSILMDFQRYFLVLSMSLRKKPHPTNLLQIAVRSRVGRLKKGGKTIQKVSKNPFQK